MKDRPRRLGKAFADLMRDSNLEQGHEERLNALFNDLLHATQTRDRRRALARIDELLKAADKFLKELIDPEQE